MKLICNVPQRRGGSPVKAKGPSGAEYTFTVDEDGLMKGEVPDEGDVAYLLALGDSFEPADESDFNRAEALLAEEEARRKAAAGEGDGSDGSGGSDDDEDDDDPIDPDAPPLEANTPAKPADPAKPKKAAAKKAAPAA